MSRIDKYLWAIRVYKTRSISSSEIKKGRVSINNKQVKASFNVKVKDILEVKKDGIVYSYKVLELLEKRVGAKLVADYVLNITSEEELEKKKQLQLIHQSHRASLQDGKSSKKDKRDLKKFMGE